MGNNKEILDRLNLIKNILKKSSLKPMFKLNDASTENFIPKTSIKSNSRILLDKKEINIVDVQKELEFKMLYIKSGSTGHTFKGIINNDKISYAIKVVAYSKKEKYGNIYDPRRPENVELLMIKLLSYFVVSKQTPHIVLPIATFNTSIIPFTELNDKNTKDVKNNKKYLDFLKRYNDNEYYNTASILISEWANRGDFLDFTRKNYMKYTLIHWKVFFFQILSVLAVIQSKYPTWRHNDMKANNILVMKVKKLKRKKTYMICKKIYTMPDVGYMLKLWDFDFACIPNLIENKKVSSEWAKKDINVSKDQNRYYDMHYFFNTLIRDGFVPQIKNAKLVPRDVYEFICRVVPFKYQKGRCIHERGRILINDEFLTPQEVLENDEFFNNFRKK